LTMGRLCGAGIPLQRIVTGVRKILNPGWDIAARSEQNRLLQNSKKRDSLWEQSAAKPII